MAYRLRIGEELPASAADVLAEQLSEAIESLGSARSLRGFDGGGDGSRSAEALQGDERAFRAEALHDARRNLKKARSLMRLLRGALPRKAYRRGMRRMRDSARAVSRLRDADALEGALAGLRDLEGSGQVPAEAFDAAEALLAARVQGVRAGGRQDLGDAAQGLREVLAAQSRWPLQRLTTERLLDGLERSYRAGRRAARVARRSGSVEDLHELRKRVKDRWYQERLVASLWPEMLESQTAEAHRLSDLLGDDHDLAILRETLSGHDVVYRDAVAVAATHDEIGDLIRFIEIRRRELQARAHLLAGRLYAERPRAYRRRMRVLLDLTGAEAHPAGAGAHPTGAETHPVGAAAHLAGAETHLAGAETPIRSA